MSHKEQLELDALRAYVSYSASVKRPKVIKHQGYKTFDAIAWRKTDSGYEADVLTNLVRVSFRDAMTFAKQYFSGLAAQGFRVHCIPTHFGR